MAVVVLSALSSGCAPPDTDASYLDDPLYSTMTSNGNGSTNKLNTYAFINNVDDLLEATKSRLVAPPSLPPVQAHFASNTYLDALLSTTDGKEVLKYAVRCAIPDNSTVYLTESSHAGYAGGGVMATTAGWASSGLSESQAEDLLACMLAHMNPDAVEVPIALFGINVTDDPGFVSTDYTFEEAFWTADIVTPPGIPNPVIGSSTTVTFHVWPLQDMKNSCSLMEITAQLKTRTCGTSQGDCDRLEVHGSLTDPDFGCTGSDNVGWTCGGRPAIKTKLKLGYLGQLWDCADPPQ